MRRELKDYHVVCKPDTLQEIARRIPMRRELKGQYVLMNAWLGGTSQGVSR